MGPGYQEASLEKSVGHAMGAEQTAAEWKKNVHLAQGTEEMKTGYIDAVLTVWNRALSHESIRKLVVRADKSMNPTPFGSIYKIEASSILQR